jgi:alkylated DNA repair dioxygenase AlkB
MFYLFHVAYLGPKPTIASLSLGVKRHFRVRKLDYDKGKQDKITWGQHIDICLPHNSLLIMKPPMQEVVTIFA